MKCSLLNMKASWDRMNNRERQYELSVTPQLDSGYLGLISSEETGSYIKN